MYMIRGTELQDFLRCRKMWSYRWIDGLQPKKQSTPLLFGTAMHKYLEVYYSGGSHRNALYAVQDLIEQTDTSQMDELDYQEMVETLNTVIENYNKRYELDFQDWEVIATELTFAIPLDDEIGYTGTIDLIVRNKSDGKIYLVDHKTTNSIEKYDKNSDMDRQISRYWWALQQLQQGNGFIKNTSSSQDIVPWVMRGEWETEYHKYLGGEIGGFIYNIILKDYAVPPKVLKNGSLSKDKSQKTTLQLYANKLAELGLLIPEVVYTDEGQKIVHSIPEEYDEIMDHLEQNPREYFRRIRVTRTQSEIDASIEELYATARDMSVTKWSVAHPGVVDYNAVYRNITKECPWCPFQPICQASMSGGNVDFLMRELYTVESTER